MLSVRQCDLKRDLQPLYELVLTSNTTPVHAADLLLALSDPSVCAERDICIWEDDRKLVGFALISCFDLTFLVKEFDRRPEAEAQIMEWAMARFKKVAAGQDYLTFFFTSVREYDSERISLLERYGFTRDDQHLLYLHYSLGPVMPCSSPPEGFKLRQSTGANELSSYVTARRNAFWMENYTEEWHRRMLEMPGYLPELDLVAVAPDETIAAFCLSWLEPSGAALNGLRRGYLQLIGTRLKFQGMGLGRALFWETLRRMHALGAEIAVGQSYSANTKALHFFEVAGVRPLHKIYHYFWQSNSRPVAPNMLSSNLQNP